MSKALEQLTRGRYADAPALVQATLDESKGVFAWRPVRAAALVALAEIEAEDRVWMTLEEFAAWRATHRIDDMRFGYIRTREAIGMASSRIKALVAGLKGEPVTPISVIEALACAHFSMGLKPPVPAGDVEAFSEWFGPRFGAVEPLARWLKVRGETITDRLRGYDMRDGRRRDRLPEIDMIRAMDWIWRVGPVCPFGIRQPVEIWPGQGVQS